MTSKQNDQNNKNWSRETRQSAPAGVPASGRRLSVPAVRNGGSSDVRERYTVTKTTKRMKTELSQHLNNRDDRRPSVRSRSNRSISTARGGEDGRFSPSFRKPSHKFTRIGTGDFVDEDEDDSDDSYNSFNVSLQKKALFEIETSHTLTVPSNTLHRSISTHSIKGGDIVDRDKAVQVYRVYRSRYEGTQFAEGNLSIHLSTGQNRKMFQRELSKPLFRWVHFENPTMNFSQFVSVALDSPWLDNSEKDTITGMLKVSRQKSERSLRIPKAKAGTYVEPEYYEERIEQTVLKGFRSRQQKAQIVRWMCLPYFIVGGREKLSKKQARERNLEVPVSNTSSIFLNSGFINEGSRYQVAQIWCLMVGESLLITSLRRPIADLPANRINIKVLPPANPDLRGVGDRAPVIIVSDGGIRTWLLPVVDCITWPQFAAHFAELNVDFSENWNILYQDTKLTRKDWPSVIKIAQRASIRLQLQKTPAEDDDNYSSDDSSIFNQKIWSTAKDIASSAAEDQLTKVIETISPVFDQQSLFVEEPEKWHIFTLLATHVNHDTSEKAQETAEGLNEPSLVLDDRILKDDCDEAHQYLQFVNKRRGENQAYAQCPMKTTRQLREFALTLLPRDGSKATGDAALQLQLMKSAYNIFTFFYPLRYDHPITHKYWGAVYRMAQNEETPVSSERFTMYLQDIRKLSHVIEDVKEELFSKRSPAHDQTNIPNEFVQAWMLCLMYFVLYGTEEMGRTRSYLRRCRSLLTQGKIKVLQRLEIVNLSDREAVSPFGACSLLIGQLLQDIRDGPLFFDRHKLASLYWNDIQTLVSFRDTTFIDSLNVNKWHFQTRFVVKDSANIA
jgi:hypothetical protein